MAETELGRLWKFRRSAQSLLTALSELCKSNRTALLWCTALLLVPICILIAWNWRYWLVIGLESYESWSRFTGHNFWTIAGLILPCILFGVANWLVFGGRPMKQLGHDILSAIGGGAVFWIIMFLSYYFLVTPPRLYFENVKKSSERQEANQMLTASNTTLFSSNAELRARMEEQKKKTNEVQSAAALAELNKTLGDAKLLTSEMKNATKEQKRWYATQAKGNDNARLQAIVDDPLPQLTFDASGAQVDSTSTDEALKRLRTKEIARDALVKAEPLRKLEPQDLATLTNCAPFVDYYVDLLKGTLQQIADENGDKLISTNFNALHVSRRKIDADFEVFRLERNDSWNFRLFFRKESGQGNYSWFIYHGGVQLFECRFHPTGFHYRVSGVPGEADKHGAAGEGKWESLNTTNLRPALMWMTSVHKEMAPLKAMAK